MCVTTICSSYRTSMEGLKTWTLLLAYKARRANRISSSLFPAYMLPQMTVILPSLFIGDDPVVPDQTQLVFQCPSLAVFLHVGLEHLLHLVAHVVVHGPAHFAHHLPHLGRTVGFAHEFESVSHLVDPFVF